MDRFDIKTGHKVVVIWDNTTTAESPTTLVQDIRAVTGELGYVAMENIERLRICKFRNCLTLHSPHCTLCISFLFLVTV